MRQPGHPMYGISRIEQGKTKVWIVRINWSWWRGKHKKPRPKKHVTVNDKYHGGKWKALRVAQQERNRLLR